MTRARPDDSETAPAPIVSVTLDTDRLLLSVFLSVQPLQMNNTFEYLLISTHLNPYDDMQHVLVYILSVVSISI